ncbi:MAG: extracellular solute-binding protein [Pararhodobacter sp.]|nr:extracellular solute-binding protein [Pararhodobacter sp.]
MKTIRALILGAFAAALPFAALAQQMAPAIEEPVTIRFYNYNLASAGLGREGTLQMLDTFAADNPLITVEGVPVPPAEVMSSVQADVIAGQGPDIAQIIFADFGYLVDNFGVPALDDIVPAQELETHLSGMFPRGVELARLDGQLYGLAYVFSTPVLFCNADLFRQAGLDSDQPPRTWDEVTAAALTIH